MTTHYTSDSKGPVEIATMNPHHLRSAWLKLRREDHPARRPEIEAMRKQVIANDLAYLNTPDAELDKMISRFEISLRDEGETDEAVRGRLTTAILAQ